MVWLLLAVVVVVLWAGAGGTGIELPRGDLPGERWGYLIGSALGVAAVSAAVVWAVLCLAVLRRTGGSAGFAFAVLFLAATVSAGLGGILGVGHKAMDARTKVEAAHEINQRQFEAAVQTFDAEEEAIGADGALAPPALKTDPNLTQAKAKIRKLRELTERRRAGYYRLTDEGRARLAALDIDAGAKREVLAAYDRDRDRGAEAVESGVALDRAVMAELDAYADFLIRRKGKWRVSGDMIEFYSDADLATFQMHQQNLQRLRIAAQARKRELETAERARTAAK